MSVEVMGWVWRSSRSKSSQRLVLLAIADCASADGGNAYPSMAELIRKTGLAERTVQSAIKELVDKLGELDVSVNGGPHGCNRYRVVMDGSTPAESAPPQNLHPAESAVHRTGEGRHARRDDPAESAPPADFAPPQILRSTPAESAPGTVIEPSVKNSSSKSSLKGVRGTRIPENFAETITPEMVAFARDHAPHVNGQRETAKFVDYWIGRTGAGAVKRDWVATWRNWMRTAEERLPRSTTQSRGYTEVNGALVREGTAHAIALIDELRAEDVRTSQLAIEGAA